MLHDLLGAVDLWTGQEMFKIDTQLSNLKQRTNISSLYCPWHDIISVVPQGSNLVHLQLNILIM